VPRLALVCSASLGQVNAIRDHSFRLARALEASGVAAHVWLRRADGSWSLPTETKGGEPWRSQSLLPDPCEYDALIVQYNPFMYGRWGFAPWLPLELVRLRSSRRRARIALMVHEPYVPMANWKWILMGGWQRAQLEAVRLSADIVFASIEAWTRMLHARRPFRQAVHLPAGSKERLGALLVAARQQDCVGTKSRSRLVSTDRRCSRCPLTGGIGRAL
jgi:hypothetical protein